MTYPVRKQRWNKLIYVAVLNRESLVCTVPIDKRYSLCLRIDDNNFKSCTSHAKQKYIKTCSCLIFAGLISFSHL